MKSKLLLYDHCNEGKHFIVVYSELCLICCNVCILMVHLPPFPYFVINNRTSGIQLCSILSVLLPSSASPHSSAPQFHALLLSDPIISISAGLFCAVVTFNSWKVALPLVSFPFPAWILQQRHTDISERPVAHKFKIV